MVSRHDRRLKGIAFLRSLRPERKVPLTKEGERIINDSSRLEKAYQQIRGKDERAKTREYVELTATR